MSDSIKPHGGKLVNRITKSNPSGLFSIQISEDLANDVENIADGIFSPLEGFLEKKDFEHVISKGRLANGLAWTIPIILDVDETTATKMKKAGKVLLQNHQGLGIAILIRLARKPSKSVSVEQIAQLEQNDSIIVEDINNALTEIVSRLEAIEDRLDREEQTVKGFAKKSKQQLND